MASPRSYDVAGPEKARPIVFLHGMRVTRRMWQPQMEKLAGEFRVVAVDLPGHGTLSGEPFHVERSADEVAAIIDAEAGGRALVVGLSLGGYVAMEFGALYPEKAAGLIVASASVEPKGWYAFPYKIFASLMEKMPALWMDWATRMAFIALYGRRRAEPLIAPGFFMRGGSAGIHEVMGMTFAPRLAAYPGPVLLLNGALDRGFRLHEKRFLNAARNGRLKVIPKAFHLANIDQPEAFTEAIREFASSIPWPNRA